MEDTSLMATSDSPATNSTLAEVKLTAHMEKIAQDFERKLFSTGGRLNLKKFFWYLISWRWNPDGTSKMATLEQSPAELKLSQGYKFLEKIQLERVACDTAKRTLGTWINPQGTMKNKDPTLPSEFTIKEQQITALANAINQSYLSKKEAHMAYFGILHAKVGYAMGVSTFSESDLATLQWKADSAYKPKIGLNRNFPREVFHGPSDYGGLSNISLYSMQGFKQIQLLIGSIRNQDEASKLILASLQYEQIESGYITPLLSAQTETTYQKWSPPTWIESVKTFLTSMNAEIKFPHFQYPQVQRERDISILEVLQKIYWKKDPSSVK